MWYEERENKSHKEHRLQRDARETGRQTIETLQRQVTATEESANALGVRLEDLKSRCEQLKSELGAKKQLRSLEQTLMTSHIDLTIAANKCP